MKALVLHERRKIPQIAGIILMDKVRLISSLEIKKGANIASFSVTLSKKTCTFKKRLLLNIQSSYIKAIVHKRVRNVN